MKVDRFTHLIDVPFESQWLQPLEERLGRRSIRYKKVFRKSTAEQVAHTRVLVNVRDSTIAFRVLLEMSAELSPKKVSSNIETSRASAPGGEK
jgi:hypothetical protein